MAFIFFEKMGGWGEGERYLNVWKISKLSFPNMAVAAI